jgi:DNA-directed RNA polymerase specialized sigma24 family protein
VTTSVSKAPSAIGDGTPAHTTSGKESSEDLDRALLTSISAGNRRAIERLYASYFSRLAKFFLELNVRADFIEDLIIDTMVDLWKEGASIGANVSVSVVIMRLAYSNGRKHFTLRFEERALLYLVYGCRHSRRDIADIMKVSTACVDLLLSDARRRHLPFSQ